MFYNCSLSHASVKRIAETINDLASKGRTGYITIGVNRDSLPEDKQAEYNTQLVTKGWTVTWQRNAPPPGWTPEQDEPVEEPVVLTPDYIEAQLDAGNEIIVELSGESNTAVLTQLVRVDDTWGTFYRADSAQTAQDVRLTFWRDAEGVTQVETWLTQDGTGKLVSLPFNADEGYGFVWVNVDDPDDNVLLCLAATISSSGIDWEAYSQNVSTTIGQIITQPATEHDPAKWDDDPEPEEPEEQPKAYTIELPDTVDGSNLYNGDTTLTDEVVYAPVLQNGNQMFYQSSLTSYDGDLPALTNGTKMFNYCSNLTSFEGDLSSLTNGTGMFSSCPNFTTFDSALPALTTGAGMFYNCSLSEASLKRIAESINDLASQGKTGSIHIGVNKESLSEDKQAMYNSILESAGWNVTWQRNAAPAGWTPDQDEPVVEPDPTDGMTIPADAELVGTYTTNGDPFTEDVVVNVIGEDAVAAVNGRQKVLYVKFYDFLDASARPTLWRKANFEGEDFWGPSKVKYTELKNYVVVRYEKTDTSTSDPGGTIVATSTDFCSFNNEVFDTSEHLNDPDINSYSLGINYYNITSRNTTVFFVSPGYIAIMQDKMGEFTQTLYNLHADFYLADS